MAELTLWFQNRGTLQVPSPLHFSIHTSRTTTCDEVKKAIKQTLTPFLDQVPSPAINIYVWNSASEDYVCLTPDHVMASNPVPEVIRDIPGTVAAQPLFFDYIWDGHPTAKPNKTEAPK